MITSGETQRWRARPVQAVLIRAVAFLVPIASSLIFVHLASGVVPMPTGSLWFFLLWWLGISAAATVVLIGIDRLTRRLLPLAALFKLSLVFPDSAPSRFKTALRVGSVGTLEERLAAAQEGRSTETPVEAAERLLGLVAALNAHDRVTRGHSERVRAYSRMIGEELRLTKEQIDLLNWAALLHDVGKLQVSEEILNKEGKPTEDEWRQIKLHTVYGAAIVAPLREWLGEWAGAVTQHHERWDGQGYPAGLAGEEIGLPGRIVSVADVFDVITSTRSYKTSSVPEDARAELARCAGTQFDPRVVRAFLNVSLGRLRFAMGPLSWLSHAPILARLPLTPAVSTVSSSVAAVVAAATTGLVGAPPVRVAPAVAAPAPVNVQPARPAVPRPPTAASVQRFVEEDGRLVVQLQDLAASATPGSLRIVDGPSAGRAVVTPGGAITFTPPPGFHGRAPIRYSVCWEGRGCDQGVINIVVRAVNDPPRAKDDLEYGAEDAQVVADVLANDVDPDGDALTISLSKRPAVGRAVVQRRKLVWTPPQDFFGRATIDYEVDDGHGGSDRARLRIVVEPRDDSPDLRPDSASTGEDNPVVIPVLANDVDRDGDALELISVESPAAGTARVRGDRIEYTPDRDANGRVAFAYVAGDGQGETVRGSVEVRVRPVNDAPSFKAGDAVTLPSTAGPQVFRSWATAISAGPADESGQRVTFAVATENETVFAPGGRPSVDADGTLRLAPADGARGSSAITVWAVDDGGKADGGVDASAVRRFTVTVRGVNTPPTFSMGPDQTVRENSGSHAVPGWAKDVKPGLPDEAAQRVTFRVSSDNPGLFGPGGEPAVSPDGTLTYTLAADGNGAALVTVSAVDDGGLADGGRNASPAQRFTITATPVNSPPSFVAGPDQTVNEDAGPQTADGWAGAIAPGPPDESAQQVTFAVSNSNPALFAAGGQPAVSASGRLTFTAAANAFGTAVVTVRAVDDGGTADGGIDGSAPSTFTISVLPQNDAPVAGQDNVSVDEDAAGVTFDVFANDSDADPGDTLSMVSFDASAASDGTLTHNGGGSFTYVPGPSFAGTQTLAYTVGDGNGGTDTDTAIITVNPVPDAPLAGDDAYTTMQDAPLVTPAPGVLANDADEDGDSLTAQTALVVPPASGSANLAADGSFTYTPNAGFAGTDVFTYRVTDTTGRTGDATVTITVASVPVVPSILYLRSTGPSSEVWDMTTTPPPASALVPDYDGDGDPGLTIDAGDGAPNESDDDKLQDWVYVAPSPLVLNGPVTLRIWGTIEGFSLFEDAHPHVWLFDCAAGGSPCVPVKQASVHIDNWNGLFATWVYHDVTVGSVSRTFAAGRELRIRLMNGHNDMWVAMTAAYPSALTITPG